MKRRRVSVVHQSKRTSHGRKNTPDLLPRNLNVWAEPNRETLMMSRAAAEPAVPLRVRKAISYKGHLVQIHPFMFGMMQVQ